MLSREMGVMTSFFLFFCCCMYEQCCLYQGVVEIDTSFKMYDFDDCKEKSEFKSLGLKIQS